MIRIRNQLRDMAFYILPSTTALMVGADIVKINRFGASALLLALAAAGYFFCVATIAGKNWMDIRALFHGVWLGTIGLAALRLTEYQEPWQCKTWILLGLAYVVFQLGATAGIACGKKFLPMASKKIKSIHAGRFRLQLQESRLFWICVITTVIGFACFVSNVAIKGFIPCFTAFGSNDYLDFYTKFHVFAVAATGISGLCYYCLKTQKNSFIRKLILLLCIFYSTFAFPILVVSRGTFVTAALSLATVVFYLHRRKLIVLITCLAVILGVYYAASQLRGYTDAQLKVFFEPAEITRPTTSTQPLTEPPTEPSTQPPTEPSTEPSTQPPTEPSTEPSTQPPTEPPTELPTEPSAQPPTEPSTEPPTQPPTEPPLEPDTFQLTPKMAFLYSYLTVSHDNFNEAVQNTVGYTYGARQLAPFNVILRSQKIAQVIDSGEHYLVRDHLNTTNLIGDFYYDLHGVGIVVFMLLWSFVFGIMQAACGTINGPFSLMIMGNTMTPVVLCFFSTWMSVFSHWMHWGVVLLLALAACITRKPLVEDSEEGNPEKLTGGN